MGLSLNQVVLRLKLLNLEPLILNSRFRVWGLGFRDSAGTGGSEDQGSPDWE